MLSESSWKNNVYKNTRNSNHQNRFKRFVVKKKHSNPNLNIETINSNFPFYFKDKNLLPKPNKMYRKIQRNQPKRQEDFLDIISNSLGLIPSLIPEVLQQAKNVFNKPEILQSLVKILTKHVMGPRRKVDSKATLAGEDIFKPTVCI